MSPIQYEREIYGLYHIKVISIIKTLVSGAVEKQTTKILKKQLKWPKLNRIYLFYVSYSVDPTSQKLILLITNYN